MANFQFRLQSVLKLRERERDQAADAVQQAQLALDKLNKQIDELTQESNLQNLVRHQASLGTVQVQQLLDVQRYQLYIAQKIAGVQSNVTLIEKELEVRRGKLVVCEQAVRVLEKLREKQQAEWSQIALIRQQARLDEWASYRHLAGSSNESLSPDEPLIT